MLSDFVVNNFMSLIKNDSFGPDKTSVLFFPKYGKLAASSRHRVYQYIPYLEREHILCDCYPFFDDDYLERYFSGKRKYYSWIKYFVKRLWHLRKVRSYDLVFIHIEIVPYFFSFPERLLSWLSIPYIIDFDDAIFHQYDNHSSWLVRLLLRNKIRNIMQGAHCVIAGNDYIASYANDAGARRVHILPTVVDMNRYSKAKSSSDKDKFIIGWIGSLSTSKYLDFISPALRELCSDGHTIVKVIGADTEVLRGIPVEYHDWDESSEIEHLHTFDVGIMPLPDDLWEKGKCGFKLIQYMAIGIPVIASPVGMNVDIVEPGINGYLASNHDDWVRSITLLRENADLRKELGSNGRKKVEAKYSLQFASQDMVRIIKSVLKDT